MNKLDLVNKMTAVLGQRQEAEKVVEKMFQSIGDALRNGEKVILKGLGSFHPRLRKTQKRHNPRTLELIQVPPKRTVKFIPSQELFK